MISRSELKAYVDDLKNLFLQTLKAGLVEIAISAKIDEVIREMGRPADSQIFCALRYWRLWPRNDTS